MCIGGTSQWPATIFRGIDQWGEPYGYLLVDPIGGAIGAFATGDGISTGGQSRTPICKLPNVEHTEQTFPLLFLYRKEVVDSGGAGRHRGGLSAESCFILPSDPGDHAGYALVGQRDSDLAGNDGRISGDHQRLQVQARHRYPGAACRARTMPADIADVRGEAVTLQLRQENFLQQPGDVYAVIWSAGGGFGDPLERDATSVREDVIDDRAVSMAAARAIYGVVLTDDGLVDADGHADAAQPPAQGQPQERRPRRAS